MHCRRWTTLKTQACTNHNLMLLLPCLTRVVNKQAILVVDISSIRCRKLSNTQHVKPNIHHSSSINSSTMPKRCQLSHTKTLRHNMHNFKLSNCLHSPSQWPPMTFKCQTSAVDQLLFLTWMDPAACQPSNLVAKYTRQTYHNSHSWTTHTSKQLPFLKR